MVQLRATLWSVQWLVVSVVLSLVLTLLANIALRVVPDLGPRIGRWFGAITAPDNPETPARSSGVRVFVPWKAMIVASIILTVLLNLLRWM